MRIAVMMLAVMFTVSVFAGEADELRQQAREDRAEAQELKDAARAWEAEARELTSDGNAQNNKATALVTRAAFAKGADKQDLLEEAADLRRSAQANYERARSLQANARDNYTAASKYESRASNAEVQSITAAQRDRQLERDQAEAAAINKRNAEIRADRERVTPKAERREVQRRPQLIRQERRQGHTEATKVYTVSIYRDKIIYDDGTSELGDEYEK
jgi:hypothetical protein